jgi:hypothetical protein
MSRTEHAAAAAGKVGGDSIGANKLLAGVAQVAANLLVCWLC